MSPERSSQSPACVVRRWRTRDVPRAAELAGALRREGFRAGWALAPPGTAWFWRTTDQRYVIWVVSGWLRIEWHEPAGDVRNGTSDGQASEVLLWPGDRADVAAGTPFRLLVDGDSPASYITGWDGGLGRHEHGAVRAPAHTKS